MNTSSMFAQKVAFRLREKIRSNVACSLRRMFWAAQGLQIGKGTRLPRISVTWPHQVRIGRHCVLEPESVFKFDGIWSPGPRILFGNEIFIGRGCEFNIRRKIAFGDRCAIASGCKFIDHDHGISGSRIDEVPGKEAEITIGCDVWLGANVIVLKGVAIGDSAVVAAGAVVNKSIPAREIWAGVPAKRIGCRE